MQDINSLIVFFDNEFKKYVENNFDVALYSNRAKGQSSEETKTFKDFILFGYDDANKETTYGLSNRNNSGMKPPVQQYQRISEIPIESFEELLNATLRNVEGVSKKLIPLTKNLNELSPSQDTRKVFRAAGQKAGKVNVALRNLLVTLHVRAYWAHKAYEEEDDLPSLDQNYKEVSELARRSYNMFCRVTSQYGTKNTLKNYNKTVLDSFEGASYLQKKHHDKGLKAMYQALRKTNIA